MINKNLLTIFYFFMHTSMITTATISTNVSTKKEDSAKTLIRTIEITKELKEYTQHQKLTKPVSPQTSIEQKTVTSKTITDKKKEKDDDADEEKQEESVKKLYFQTPSTDQLQQAETLIKALKEYTEQNQFTHIHFTKNDNEYESHIQAAIHYLILVLNIFSTDQEEQSFERIDIAQKEFLKSMNDLYMQTFKPKLVSTKQNPDDLFLCIKHQFKNPDTTATSKIISLPKKEAVMALVRLILLWEIYTNLFPKSTNIVSKAITTLAPNINGINLPYFQKLNFSVNKWIEETKDAGFKKQSEFLKEISQTLDKILPKIDNNQPSKFSIGMEKIRNTINTMTQKIKTRAELTGSWFKQTWENIKVSLKNDEIYLTEELDEL